MDDTGVAELREWTIRLDSLLELAGKIELIEAPVELTPEMISSNAKNTQGIYKFESWNNILDGDHSTMFVSQRYTDSDDGLDHYVQVDLGEDAQVRNFSFSYGTRNTSSSSFAPKAMTVYSSADGESWNHITSLTGLPAEYPTLYTSEILTSPEPARHIRLMVTDTYSGLQSAGHYYFGISRLGISTTNQKTTINSDKFPYVGEEMFTDAYNSSSSGKALLTGRSTALQRLQAVDDVKQKYDVLSEAMDRSQVTGIITVETDQNTFDPALPAFDLMGRLVRNPATPGIYIQRGRKYIVK